MNVALLPPPEIAGVLIRLSREIAERFGAQFVLDGGPKAHPHLTLYMSGYPGDVIEELERRAGELTESYGAVEIAADRWLVTKQGTVLLTVKKSEALEALHIAAVERLNPLRDGAKAQLWEERRERFTPEELSRLASVGFPQSLAGWSPHFTVAKVKPECRDDLLRHLGTPAWKSFRSSSLALGTVGEHGALKDIVRLWALG